ncbi:uncharacterized protein LOC131181010 [Hevea brasiliensis]|uniref:uncharacterized protein LOC131181010 n=1 Tax=Hevea brasiliensis TaxID=3981 RepID=UPI0025ED6166|nr:uncharacterized protein LOC131181010 [Hevea brasiliensis]
MAGNSSRPILVTLLLFSMALSLLSSCYAARDAPPYHVKDPGVGGSRIICPACVCCKPPPPGSCCKCCAAPIVTQPNKGSP